MKTKQLLKVTVYAALVFILNSCTQKTPKVLIIGIDGCRPDAMLVAQTPALDDLMWNGAYCLHAQTDEMTFSGPAWSAMLTGAWHAKHGVVTNGYENPDTANYPHFFRRLKENNPQITTYSLCTWAPIHKILQNGDADFAAGYPNDQTTAAAVVEKLLTEDPDVIFVQLDEVDGAGHSYDYTTSSAKYLEAIEKADKQIGQMVGAVKDRETFQDEDWLILITTDHGGSEYGHGKNIPAHRTVFMIAHGEKYPEGEIYDTLKVTDIAVTAMKHFNVESKVAWNLDGKGISR